MTTSRRLPAIAASLFFAASLTVVGCSSSEPVSGSSPIGATPSTPSGESAAPSGSGQAAPDADALLAAIALAEQEAGGTAFELDRDDDSWQVDVAVGDRVIDVDVSLDGASVQSVDDEDSLDDDDRAALAAATIGIGDAITTALAQVPGVVDDVELDDDDGPFGWDVQIDRDGQDDDDTSVRVGVDGSVLGGDTDDDDNDDNDDDN